MEKIIVLIADDDKDDQSFAEKAIQENYIDKDIDIDIHSVTDGESLLRFLRKEDEFKESPRPSIVFLDLKMPKMGGIESLIEIREDEELRDIPIIVLTTSRSREDIEESYQSGANSYITKPGFYDDLKEIMYRTGRFWFESAKLPRGSK